MKRKQLYAFIFFILAFSSVHCTEKLYRSKTKGYYKLESKILLDINNSTDSCIIAGKIIDNKSKSPIPYGWVKIYGTKIGVNADSLGNYLLKVAPGKYKLSSGSGSHVKLTTKNIKFDQTHTTHIDFYLGSYSIY